MNNKIETLGDEERSYDSEDGERSNVSDLFASQDDEAGERQRPGLTESLDSTSEGNVPLLSISEPQGGDGTAGKEKEEEDQEPRGRTGRGAISQEPESLEGGRGSSHTMQFSDLGSGNRHGKRANSLPPLAGHSLERGHVTRVDGLVGQSHDPRESALTQRFSAMPTREPLIQEPGTKKKADHLGRPQDLEKLPPPTKEEQGGIEMFWEESGTPWGGQEELSPEEQIALDQEELELEGGRVYEEFCAVLARAKTYVRTKDSLLEESGETGIVQMREEALESQGTLMKQLLVPQEMKDAMNISFLDWASRFEGLLQGDFEALQRAAMPHKLTATDVTEILSMVTGKLEEGATRLPGNQQLVEELKQRHKVLADGLAGKGRISQQTALLFPKDKAEAIMGWYIRLLAGLEELERLWSTMYRSQQALVELLEEYPGPAIPVRGTLRVISTPLPRQSVSKPQRFEYGIGVSPLTEKVGEAPQRGLGGGDYRREAAQAGRDFRMGGGGGGSGDGERTRFWVGDEDPEASGVKVNDLPLGLIKSQRGEPSVKGSEHTYSSYESEGLSGFDGDSKETIMTELYLMVADTLAAWGMGTRVTEAIIMDHVPPLHFRTKNAGSVTKDFSRVAKEVKPEKGFTLSIGEWWALINELGNDHGWSFAMRIRWLTRTAGLAAKVNEGQAARIKAIMKDIKRWMPDYDLSRSESEGRYWLYCWIKVGLKMIEEFHQVEPTEVIEGALEELMAEDEYQLVVGEDPLNSQFHKVDSLYKAMYTMLRDKSSDLISSPLYVWKLLTGHLKAQTPIGPLMMTHINKSLNKLGVNPTEAFPANHMMTDAELREVKRRGVAGASEKTYGAILTLLKHRALNGDLAMEFKSFEQMAGSVQHQAGEKTSSGGWSTAGKRKSEKKVNAVSVSTDFSTLTLNTAVTGKGGGRAPRYPCCKWCRLFHEAIQDGCPFWDATKREFKIGAFLKFRSVRLIGPDGSSTLSEYWVKKLYQYAFPSMGITADSDRLKIIADLKKAASKLPKASQAEIEKFAKDSATYVSLAISEDNSHINTMRRETEFIVNAVAQMRLDSAEKKGAEKARAQEKKKRKKARDKKKKEAESDSSSSSDSEYDSSSSGD